jgi:hypothetical protein
MTWSTSDPEIANKVDAIRVRLQKGRSHAFDWERPANYKDQAKAEMARRLVAESDLDSARRQLDRLANLEDILVDLKQAGQLPALLVGFVP